MLKKYRRILFPLIFILVLILVLYIFRQPILLGIGGYLIVNDELQRADVIKVLERGPERVDYAIELYKQGYARYILFSGSEAKMMGVTKDWPELAKEYAISRGIPAEAILLGGLTMSTYDEAVNLSKVMKEHGFHSAIIVSDPPHMRRVAMTFDRLVKDGNIKLIYRPVSLEKSEFALIGWWEDEGSLVTVVNEYFKIVFYYFKYFI